MNEDARVLTWDELWTVMPFVVWRENKVESRLPDYELKPMAFIAYSYQDREVTSDCIDFKLNQYWEYGKKYRCWSACPTEKQRRETPWRRWP